MGADASDSLAWLAIALTASLVGAYLMRPSAVSIAVSSRLLYQNNYSASAEKGKMRTEARLPLLAGRARLAADRSAGHHLSRRNTTARLIFNADHSQGVDQ